MGLPGDMVPGLNTIPIDRPAVREHGLRPGIPFRQRLQARHMEASMNDPALRGTQLNGASFPARSDNDTGNNPHNPMKGIAQAPVLTVRF